MQTNAKKLSEKPTEGIYLIESHARLIWENKKSLIITSKLYPEMIYRPLYLLGNNLCYGVIELKQPKQINLDQFNELSSAHQINEENREKWWPKEESLFAYPYDIVEFYDKPQKMQLSKEIQTSIKDIQFLEFTPSENTGDILSLASGFQPIVVIQEHTEKELFIRKRGDRWCVTHSDGKIIKCFPVKAQAEAMHKAIIISKIKRGEMSENNSLNVSIP